MPCPCLIERSRDAARARDTGFTLIELLIVVIIIGVLAAIAVPLYVGVKNSANEEGTRSDLVNNKIALTAYSSSSSGNIPAAITDYAIGSVPANSTTGASAVDLIKSGWSRSTTTSALVYEQSGANAPAGVWCLTATSVSAKRFYISSNTKVTNGSCPADVSTW